SRCREISRTRSWRAGSGPSPCREYPERGRSRTRRCDRSTPRAANRRGRRARGPFPGGRDGPRIGGPPSRLASRGNLARPRAAAYRLLLCAALRVEVRDTLPRSRGRLTIAFLSEVSEPAAV